jgi:hypothetical protein
VPWPGEKVTLAVSESKSLAVKEAFKRLLLSAATLIGGWPWAAAQRIFDDDQPFSNAPIGLVSKR